MSEDKNNINYSGKPGEYEPGFGSWHGFNQTFTPAPQTSKPQDLLINVQNKIGLLVGDILKINQIFESELNQHVLPISTTSPSDNSLREAQKAVWPSELGDIKYRVTYPQYKALKPLNTAAGNYIRERWENAASGTSGLLAFDLKRISDVVLNEAFLMTDWLDNYIGDVDDSSEKTSLLLFDDWLTTALDTRAYIYSQWSDKNNTPQIPEEDKVFSSPDTIQQAQGIFQSKVNAISQQASQKIGSIEKNFAEYSKQYYENILGPAVKFRLNISRNQLPVGQFIEREAYQGAESFNANLSVILADQIRRHTYFREHIPSALALLSVREAYKGYIQQLEERGNPIPKGTSDTLIREQVTADELNYFGLEAMGTKQTTPDFSASHSLLVDRESDDAHPQYALTVTTDAILEALDLLGVEFDDEGAVVVDTDTLVNVDDYTQVFLLGGM